MLNQVAPARASKVSLTRGSRWESFIVTALRPVRLFLEKNHRKGPRCAALLDDATLQKPLNLSAYLPPLGGKCDMLAALMRLRLPVPPRAQFNTP